MPFIAPVIAAVSTFAASSAIAGFIVNTAISFAISYVATKLTKKDQKRPAELSGTVLREEFGEGLPRRVALGVVASAGRRRYDNTYGSNNKSLQRVRDLSDYYSAGLQRVLLNGEYVTLGGNTSKGRPVTSGEFKNKIWVKFHDGKQTSADSYLVSNANPNTKWSNAHIGTGIAHAIVSMDYDRNAITSVPDFIFELKGAPLYDWRKDSSVGGSGSHRWNDVSTWEFSENPIVMVYNYCRGAFKVNGDQFLGMDIDAAELPFDKYTVAANICDEIVDGEARYRCSIVIGADNTHEENLSNILRACAGMMVSSTIEHYPIINAAQMPVRTLSSADIVDGTVSTFDRDGDYSDLVNSIAGTYTSSELLYKPAGYATQTLDDAIVSDRKKRDVTMNLGMVPSKRQAEQVASISLSETRYRATATRTVDPLHGDLEVGDWITWADDDDGESRTYQIMATHPKRGVDAKSIIGVMLTLRERHFLIYVGVGPVAPPVIVPRNTVAIVLNEVNNFGISAIYLDGQIPAFRVSWSNIVDQTVDGVEVQWRVKGDAGEYFSKLFKYDANIGRLQEGVVGGVEYEVRTKLVAERNTVATDWVTISANPSNSVITLAQMQEDFREPNRVLNSKLDELTAAVIQISMAETADDLASHLSRKVLSDKFGSSFAQIVNEQQTLTDATSAQASQVTALNSAVGEVSAQGLFSMQSSVSPDGVDASFVMALRAAIGDAYETMGFFGDLTENPPGSGDFEKKIRVLADLFSIQLTDGTVVGAFAGGKLNGLLAPTITAEMVIAGVMNLSATGIGGVALNINGQPVLQDINGQIKINADHIQIGQTSITDGSLAKITSYTGYTVPRSLYYDSSYNFVEVSGVMTRPRPNQEDGTGKVLVKFKYNTNTSNSTYSVNDIPIGDISKTGYRESKHPFHAMLPMSMVSAGNGGFRCRHSTGGSFVNGSAQWIIKKYKTVN